MDSTTSAIFVGLKIAVFSAILVMAFLIESVDKRKKQVHGINLFAIMFIVIALAEFFHVIASSHTGVLNWITNHKNLYLITHTLSIVGALGLIWYFTGIKKNIKNYK